MTDQEILNSIPHRPPMLLIDEVVGHNGDAITCRKTFRADEFFFQGHYPGNPIVPGVILCECAAQAGALLLSRRLEQTNGTPMLTRMSEVRFKRPVFPGDEIEIRASLEEELSKAYFLAAKVLRQQRVVASMKFACTLAE